MARPLRTVLRDRVSVYHVFSNRREAIAPFSTREQNRLVEVIHRWAEFCQLDILAYVVTRDLMEILVRVPKPRRIGEARLKSLVRTMYGADAAEELESTAPGSRDGKALRKKYLDRMFDLTAYCKLLKQEFAHWIRRNRGGEALVTVWTSRFRSNIVKPSADAILDHAMEIDILPVHQRRCRTAAAYKRSSYGAAVSGDGAYRDFIVKRTGAPDWDSARSAYEEWMSEVPVRGERRRRSRDEIAYEKSLDGVVVKQKGRPKREVLAVTRKRLRELKAFKRRFGHCKVPPGWEENPDLARWVRAQRKGSASPRMRATLDELGFDWSPWPRGRVPGEKIPYQPIPKEDRVAEKRWHDRYRQLVEFVGTHGHFRVPSTEDFTLHMWIRTQRYFRGKKLLSDERIALLDKIGFPWSGREAGRVGLAIRRA